MRHRLRCLSLLTVLYCRSRRGIPFDLKTPLSCEAILFLLQSPCQRLITFDLSL